MGNVVQSDISGVKLFLNELDKGHQRQQEALRVANDEARHQFNRNLKLAQMGLTVRTDANGEQVVTQLAPEENKVLQGMLANERAYAENKINMQRFFEKSGIPHQEEIFDAGQNLRDKKFDEEMKRAAKLPKKPDAKGQLFLDKKPPEVTTLPLEINPKAGQPPKTKMRTMEERVDPVTREPLQPAEVQKLNEPKEAKQPKTVSEAARDITNMAITGKVGTDGVNSAIADVADRKAKAQAAGDTATAKSLDITQKQLEGARDIANARAAMNTTLQAYAANKGLVLNDKNETQLTKAFMEDAATNKVVNNTPGSILQDYVEKAMGSSYQAFTTQVDENGNYVIDETGRPVPKSNTEILSGLRSFVKNDFENFNTYRETVVREAAKKGNVDRYTRSISKELKSFNDSFRNLQLVAELEESIRNQTDDFVFNNIDVTPLEATILLGDSKATQITEEAEGKKALKAIDNLRSKLRSDANLMAVKAAGSDDAIKYYNQVVSENGKLYGLDLQELEVTR